MAYGGPYPGVTRGVYVDRAHVEETFLKRTEFMRKTGTPIWIGEFGPVFTNDAEARRGQVPAARRPARHLQRARRELVDLGLQGRRPRGCRGRRAGFAVDETHPPGDGEEGPAQRR